MRPLFILLVYWGITSCANEDALLYSSKTPITGTVVYNNTELKDELLIPASGIEVFLRKEATSDEYLVKAKTDAKGYYEFPYVPTQQANWVWAEGKLDSVDFSGKQEVKSADKPVSLTLTPNYKNALKITVKDGQDKTWHQVAAFLYRNETLADAVFALKKKPESGFVATATTNENGFAIFTNLLPRQTYHVLVIDNLGGKALLGESKNIQIDPLKLTAKDIKISIQ